MILLRNIQLDGAPVNLFIEGSRIRRILPFPETDGLVADETVDGTGKAVIPGFINMHTHAAMIMLRGITEDVPLHEWLSKIWEMEAKMDEEFIYWGTKAACLEMIRSGTTTFNDMYWFAPFARQAAVESRPSRSANASSSTSGRRTGAKPPTSRCPSMPSIP